MKQGFFGHTYPKLSVLFEILFGLYRGLLPLSPVLIISVFGIRRIWKDKVLRPELLLCTAVVGFFLLLNASYVDWDGGMTLGPRHVVPMLPFLSLLLAFGLGKWWLLSSLLLVVSAGHMLAGAVFRPIVPSRYQNVLFEYLYAQILDGRFAWNWLINPLGFRSVRGFMLLSAVWLVAITLLVAQTGQSPRVKRTDAG
jgi:hypothetical protein